MAAVGCAALGVFASGLYAESFEDEYAYISQSYYADAFFGGHADDWTWLDLPAYDLPPLPKYLIGFSVRSCHLPMPRPIDAHQWYRSYKSFGSPGTLTAARVPIILVGVLGCVAIFACGAVIKDDRVGTIAAILLMLNPLFRLHAHRAMSDIPSESFMLVALWLELWAWHRVWSGRIGLVSWLLPLFAGLAVGLALLSKFNGFLALMIVGIWSGAAVLTHGLLWSRKLTITGGAIVTGIVALALFVALNPFMTARPTGGVPAQLQLVQKQLRPDLIAELAAVSKLNITQRFRVLVDQRLAVASHQKKTMPHNALNDLGEKFKVFAAQGFGRFGLFGPAKSDSRVRYDLRQDLGSIVWAPLVLIGLVQSFRSGRRQLHAGEAPTGIALMLWGAITWVVVTIYLPMAWDRYLLPPQSVNALLAALALSAIYDRVVHHIPLVGTRT